MRSECGGGGWVFLILLPLDSILDGRAELRQFRVLCRGLGEFLGLVAGLERLVVFLEFVGVAGNGVLKRLLRRLPCLLSG